MMMMHLKDKEFLAIFQIDYRAFSNDNNYLYQQQTITKNTNA